MHLLKNANNENILYGKNRKRKRRIIDARKNTKRMKVTKHF